MVKFSLQLQQSFFNAPCLRLLLFWILLVDICANHTVNIYSHLYIKIEKYTVRFDIHWGPTNRSYKSAGSLQNKSCLHTHISWKVTSNYSLWELHFFFCLLRVPFSEHSEMLLYVIFSF